MVTRLLQRGFTLVELVVTLVIIGALAAVSAPLFFSKQNFEDAGFFNETLSALRYAQKVAVASGCTVRVSVTSNGYSLLRAANAAACTSGPFTTALADPADPARPFTRSSTNVTLAPALDFTFSPLGSASVAAPSQTLTVGGRQLRIWAATGYVERL